MAHKRFDSTVRSHLKLPNDVALYNDWMAAKDLFVETSARLFKRLHIIRRLEFANSKSGVYYLDIVINVIHLSIELAEDILVFETTMLVLPAPIGWAARKLKFTNYNIILNSFNTIVPQMEFEAITPPIPNNVIRLVSTKEEEKA